MNVFGKLLMLTMRTVIVDYIRLCNEKAGGPLNRARESAICTPLSLMAGVGLVHALHIYFFNQEIMPKRRAP